MEIKDVLNEPTFTVKAKLPYEEEGERKEIEAEIVYRMSGEIEEKINSADPPLSAADQLALVVISIKGVKGKIDAAYFRRLHPRQRKAVITAIMEDVYPNEKPSAS